MSGATISKRPKSPPELIRQSNLRHQAGSKWGREEEGLIAMDLPRPALDANFMVWKEAVVRFSEMPGTTFLIANAVARLAVETPAQATRAITWLALNDIVQAYIDGAESTRPMADRIAQLAARLELAVISLSATAPNLPVATDTSIYQALDLLVPAASWASTAARGLSAGPSARLQRLIMQLYEDLPAVPLLPTLDPSPID
jgi:hypothetical protein